MLFTIALLGAYCHSKKSARHEFAYIDAKLIVLSKQLGGTLDTLVGGSTINNKEVPKNKLVTRKVVWVDGNIRKAIIISNGSLTENVTRPHGILQILHGSIPYQTEMVSPSPKIIF